VNKYCEKLNQQLLGAGFNSQIIREDLIELDSPFTNTRFIKNYYIRFDGNRVLVFTMVNIVDILSNIYSDEDLAYVLSQKIFKKDGIRVSIRDGSLLIFSIVKTSLLTSLTSLYSRVYNTIIKCQCVFEDITDELEFIRKFNLKI
jgi:hypothetical protein